MKSKLKPHRGMGECVCARVRTGLKGGKGRGRTVFQSSSKEEYLLYIRGVNKAACGPDTAYGPLWSGPQVSDRPHVSHVAHTAPGLHALHVVCGASLACAICSSSIRLVLCTGSRAGQDWAHTLSPCAEASMKGRSDMGTLCSMCRAFSVCKPAPGPACKAYSMQCWSCTRLALCSGSSVWGWSVGPDPDHRDMHPMPFI